ncbi:MAG: glycosyltransferase family 39 protein [Terracidiphilus sp.]
MIPSKNQSSPGAIVDFVLPTPARDSTNTRPDSVRSAGPIGASRNSILPALLAIFTLVTRILCRGPLYFGDGPRHIKSILDKTYIIQPPGYWLFNRIAGLFPDPVLAIVGMNILFSVAGVVVFYYTACLFASRVQACIAAFAYATIFYVWCSGEIHSTYASQILFPVATFLVLLHYERDRAPWQLALAACLFAVGAGLRPSDGMFLIPMLVYFALFRMPRKTGLLFLALAGFLCLGWLIPTWLAYEHGPRGLQYPIGYIVKITAMKSVLHGINRYSMANIARFVVPLVAGFWPVLGVAVRNAIRNRSDWRVKAILLWIVPGSLFFVLIFIADAPYLNFLTAAILLLAVSAPRWMMVTALWNAVVFLALSPIPSQRLAVNVVNSFVLKYTRGGIQQQDNTPLSAIQNSVDGR